jgi:hypothetical protein
LHSWPCIRRSEINILFNLPILPLKIHLRSRHIYLESILLEPKSTSIKFRLEIIKLLVKQH